MTRRARIRGYGSAALLVLAGAVGAAVIGGGLGQILALALIGLGFVSATSLIFLEVGLSEDRDRAREEAAARARAGREGAARGAARVTRPRPGRPRLDRSRGRRRRLD